MVVIDASILLLLLRPETPVPAGSNGLPIDNPKGRIDHLVEKLTKDQSHIIIPTPALSEVLVRAGASASEEIVTYLQKSSVFRIEAFDTRAAIEVAAMTRTALSKRGNRTRSKTATYAKLKYDRQIVAIAKTTGATTIFSDDEDIRRLGANAKIEVLGISDLPLPPQSAQYDFLEGLPEESSNPGGAVDDKASAPNDNDENDGK